MMPALPVVFAPESAKVLKSDDRKDHFGDRAHLARQCRHKAWI